MSRIFWTKPSLSGDSAGPESSVVAEGVDCSEHATVSIERHPVDEHVGAECETLVKLVFGRRGHVAVWHGDHHAPERATIERIPIFVVIQRGLQSEERLMHLLVWLLVRGHHVPVLRPPSIGSALQLTPLDLDDNQAFQRMDEQNVDFAHAGSFARLVGDVEVVGDGPAFRLEFLSERGEGSPLSLVRER